jgi:hypothetical protein
MFKKFQPRELHRNVFEDALILPGSSFDISEMSGMRILERERKWSLMFRRGCRENAFISQEQEIVVEVGARLREGPYKATWDPGHGTLTVGPPPPSRFGRYSHNSTRKRFRDRNSRIKNQ